MDDQMTIDYRKRYRLMCLFIPLAMVGCLVMGGAWAYAESYAIVLQNSAPAVAILLGLVATIPAVIYGLYCSVCYWKDKENYNDGKKILITTMVLLLVQINGFSPAYLAIAVYYIYKVHPDMRDSALGHGESAETL